MCVCVYIFHLRLNVQYLLGICFVRKNDKENEKKKHKERISQKFIHEHKDVKIFVTCNTCTFKSQGILKQFTQKNIKNKKKNVKIT